jgi:hypothetical protein
LTDHAEKREKVGDIRCDAITTAAAAAAVVGVLMVVPLTIGDALLVFK